MSRARLPDYVLAGLLAWGLPSAIVVGPVAILWVALAALPVWGLRMWMARQPPIAPREVDPPLVPLAVLAAGYVVVDALVGRKKLEQNMFLHGSALERAIEQINETVSQGRGIAELIGAVTVFLPFALFDLARRSQGRAAVIARVIAVLLIFYEAAISRGFALVAVLALLAGAGAVAGTGVVAGAEAGAGAGSRISLRRVALAGAVALGIFGVASFLRGDFQEVSFSNPLFDAVGWPYINLALLSTSGCGTDGVLSYGVEFLKKFLPAFLFPKTIFTFNVEMTRCVYPFFGDTVASVSVFTWVGELLYYSPAWATALLAGCLLALVAAGCEVLLSRADLPSTRAFAGLMCIVLLRSRTQDVLSYLVFLALFLGGWIGITTEPVQRWLRRE